MNITLYRYQNGTPWYYTFSLDEERKHHSKILVLTENKHISNEVIREFPFADKLELADLLESLLREKLEEGCRMLCFYAKSSRLHSLIVDTVRTYRDVTTHGATNEMVESTATNQTV